MNRCSILQCIFLVCTGVETFAGDSTFLTGMFVNHPSTSFRVVTNQSLKNAWAGDQLATGTTDGAGNFSAGFKLNTESQVLLFIGAAFYKLWLDPGASLNITQKPTGISFAGSVARENKFMYAASLMQPFSVNHGFDQKFQPEEVKTYFDSLETGRWKLYHQFFTNEKPSQKFKDYCEGQITGFTCFSLSQYPMKFIYIDKSIGLKDVPGSYLEFWKKFRIQETDPGSDMYHNALRDYVAFLAMEQDKLRNISAQQERPPQQLQVNADLSRQENQMAIQLQIMDSLLADNPATLAVIKAVQIDFMIKYFDFHNLTRTAIDKYANQFPGSEEARLLTDKWQEKNKLTSSKPSFTLTNNEGRHVSLQDLNGSVVYIDFWGSWCKACLSQMPSS
ncbi:MAG: TlpA family protein disulfide reductase, partial [Chitinophagaceae bacterium]